MTRQIQAIYCDDIRLEVGNKRSLMGVYMGQLYVATAPITLPKLCVSAHAATPIDRPFERLTFRLLMDDKELASAEFDAETLAMQGQLVSRIDDLEDAHLNVVTEFVLSPFTIEGPCILRLRVETEEGELKGPGLRVLVAEPPTSDDPTP